MESSVGSIICAVFGKQVIQCTDFHNSVIAVINYIQDLGAISLLSQYFDALCVPYTDIER